MTSALYYLVPSVAAFAVACAGTALLIPRLLRSNLAQPDVHKPDRPLVPELGGVAVFGGVVAGMSTAIGLATFTDLVAIQVAPVSAAVATVAVVAVIGLMDDLVDVRQGVKALLPAFSALPLMAVKAGVTTMHVPFLGPLDLGILYALVVIPLIVTATANASNMLASFNGIESGLGAIMFGTLSVIGAAQGNTNLLAVALPCMAACLGFLAFNWTPAKAFPGDVGTLTIGAAFGAAVIVGNVETVAAFLLVPFILDLLIKLPNGLPKTFGRVVVGNPHHRLVCPADGPKGLGQLVLKLAGPRGLTEQGLVLCVLGLEALCAAAALVYVLA